MAKWGFSRDECRLHNVEMVQTCRNDVLSMNLDFPVEFGGIECENRVRYIFDQVLLFFLRRVSINKSIRPIPAILGNGQPVDLFKLFWVVRRLGGYDSVSRDKSWGLVTTECRLTVEMAASLKLVYAKYLCELEQGLKKGIRGKGLGSLESEVQEKLNLLLYELEELRSSFPVGKNKLNEVLADGFGYGESEKHISLEMSGNEGRPVEKNSGGKLVEALSNEKGVEMDFEKGEAEVKMVGGENLSKVHPVSDGVSVFVKGITDKVLISSNENGVALSSKSIVEDGRSSLKRKRDSSSFSQMLKWIAHAARNSDDPAIGTIPDCSKWKDYGCEELWMQSLFARNVLLVRRNVDSDIEESCSQKKIRMHPSMYEDDNISNQQSAEGLRASKRLPLVKGHLCPCCSSCSASQNKLHSPRNLEPVNNKSKEQDLKSIEMSTDDPFFNQPREKHISVGPCFQAEVPVWTGVASESDSKWIGTQMWPPLEDSKHKPVDESDRRIGRVSIGRCLCPFRGSTSCVSFHIAENRVKLKLELGPLFYRWKFKRMGEEVSLSWTREEEKRFREMVDSSPVTMSKFWRNAFKFFPTKNRETLVSYYFNVFVIRRRSYQNRVTPKDIDSDDDEKPVGSVGDSFGYETIHSPNPELPICVQNMQCTDLKQRMMG